MPGDTEEMSLLVGFPDGSPSFVNGFEAGAIWQQLDSGSIEPIDRGFDAGFPVHTENLEVIRRMAKARGFNVETRDECEEGWTPLRLSYVGEGRTKPKLSLVPSTDEGKRHG